MGFKELKSPEDYNMQKIIGTTDGNGVAILKLTPNSTWQLGEHRLGLIIEHSLPLGNETAEIWFKIEGPGEGGG